MSTTALLGIQSLLVSLQIINAGVGSIAHAPSWLPLVIAAIIGGGQFFVQNTGNKTIPPPPPTKP